MKPRRGNKIVHEQPGTFSALLKIDPLCKHFLLYVNIKLLQKTEGINLNFPAQLFGNL